MAGFRFNATLSQAFPKQLDYFRRCFINILLVSFCVITKRTQRRLLKGTALFKRGGETKAEGRQTDYFDSVYNFRDAFMMMLVKKRKMFSFYVFYSLREITQLRYSRVYVKIILLLILIKFNSLDSLAQSRNS